MNLKPELSNTYGGVHRRRDAASLRRRSPKGSGVFICDRCRRTFPEDEMVWQDGLRLCRSACFDLLSAVEMRVMLAEAEGTPEPNDPVIYGPGAGFFSGAPLVYQLTDGSDNTVEPGSPISITNGGASVTLKLTGYNLSSSDTIAYSDAGITDATTPTITATLVTLDLQASGATPGLAHITYNGTKFRDVISVR